MKFTTTVLAGFVAGCLTAIPCEARVARYLPEARDLADRNLLLKEVVVVRGPHSMECGPKQDMDDVRDRMVAFAAAAVQGRGSRPGAKPWTSIRELVATTPDSWEPSSRPR